VKNITKDELILMATVHCTMDEICGYYQCSKETIRNRCQEFFDMSPEVFLKAHQGAGKVSLRRKGFQMALKGDRDMLKLHLKNHCDFVDKVDNTHSGPNGGAIKTDSTSTVLSGEFTYEQLKAEAEKRGLPLPNFDKDS